MKISEKLQKRLLDDLGLKVELPEKIPRGFHGRCAGQWAWMARFTEGGGDIGSEDTMVQCVKAKKISKYRGLRSQNITIIAEEG